MFLLVSKNCHLYNTASKLLRTIFLKNLKSCWYLFMYILQHTRYLFTVWSCIYMSFGVYFTSFPKFVHIILMWFLIEKKLLKFIIWLEEDKYEFNLLWLTQKDASFLFSFSWGFTLYFLKSCLSYDKYLTKATWIVNHLVWFNRLN